MTTDSLKTRDLQIKLIMELDAARDALQDDDEPTSMFQVILKILRTFFNADACAVMLIDESEINIDLIVAYGITEDKAQMLCREALDLDKPDKIPSDDWKYTLGLRIILEKQLLGSIFLTRQNEDFTGEEKTLLEYAESQIDSAVIQARRMWKLAQRNRELEAIYQIDRLRDDISNENDLVNGFTSLVIDYFKAELCVLMLTHIDTGEMLVRGVVGKNNLAINALDNIRELVGNIMFPQIIPTPGGLKEMVLLAAPLIVAHVRLGSVIVGRAKRFTIADQRLMAAMASQMDSAVVHSRVIHQLTQRNKELEVIYKIDSIRDKENDFDMMMQRVLTEICKLMSSELGYLMLYNANEEEQLELKVSTLEGIANSPVYYEILKRYSRDALEQGSLIFSNRPEGPVRSIIAIPLILNDMIIGVFGTVNSMNPRGFSSEDRRMLTAITSQVDTAIFERLERRRMRRVLGRSVDPKILEHLLQRTDDRVLAGERVVISILFADLRGSTEWAERTEPEELVTTLNAFLSKMTDVIFKHGGTLDKFVGDEVIALFGVPVSIEDHAYQAVSAAIEMQRIQQALKAELAQNNIELPAMGIGISSGEVIAGEIGPSIRTDFTALGRNMNLGARLCSAAPADEIYISETTYETVKNLVDAEVVPTVKLKGLGDVSIYRLQHIRGT